MCSSPGSDHLTAYNLFAEAVNQHGSLGNVHGLARHVFDEGIDEWAERRGVLVKAIEDAALGRGVDLPRAGAAAARADALRRQGAPAPLGRPARAHHAVRPGHRRGDRGRARGARVRRRRWREAGARWRDRSAISPTGSGSPRASIEGTTLSYDLIREHAAWSPPEIQVTGDGRRQGLAIVRRLRYFGFELEAEVEPSGGCDSGGTPGRGARRARDGPDERRDAAFGPGGGDARGGDAGRVVAALRRDAGAAAPEAVKSRIRAQLDEVGSWSDFLRTRLVLAPAAAGAAEPRQPLERLPGHGAGGGGRGRHRVRAGAGKPDRAARAARRARRGGSGLRRSRRSTGRFDSWCTGVKGRRSRPRTIDDLLERLDALPRRTGTGGRAATGGRHRRGHHAGRGGDAG